jgi:hypothetical protein
MRIKMLIGRPLATGINIGGWANPSICNGLANIPASWFSKYIANGLWKYSSLLCGARLVEGLVLVQRIAMKLWDSISEPTLVLDLHNMLVKKRYLEEVGLYATLESLHENSFFPQ